MDAERFRRVIERIDELNSQDPNTELVNGIASPRELLYSQRVTEWVLRLKPDASEELRIAARGQHLCRWTIPRDRYERNRRGYLRWREALKAFHEPFFADMEKAKTEMRNVKRQEIPTDFSCEKCASPMVIKWGRRGEFLACTNYPECKYTREFERDDDGSIRLIEAELMRMVGAALDCPLPPLLDNLDPASLTT